MKISRIVLALSVLLIPIVARSLWFYQGAYQPSSNAAVPDFSQSDLSFPELSTAMPTAKTISQTGQVVLFDQQHGNLFNFSEISPLIDEIQALGADWEVIESDGDLSQSLKRAESFVVIAPTIPFTGEEINAVKAFTARGGRFLVVTDPTRNSGYYDPGMSSMGAGSSSIPSSTIISNLLLNPFNISFEDDYLYNLVRNEGNFRHIIFSDFSDSSLTSGLDEIVLYSAHSLQTGGEALITTDDQTFSSLTDSGGSLAVAALTADGNVAAIGDLTFLSSPYSQVADNPKLIRNLASFLVKSERPAQLADFPYLFDRDVAVLFAEDFDLNSTVISQIASMQNTLRSEGLAVNLAEGEAESDSDLLVIGSFPPSEDIRPYIESFNINFEVDEDAGEEGSVDEDNPSETPGVPGSATPSTSGQSRLPATPTFNLALPPTPTIRSDLAVTPTPASDLVTPTPRSSPSVPPGILPGLTGTRTVETPIVPDPEFPFDSFESFDAGDTTGSSGTMDIPGFGKVPMDGLSLILFQPGKEQNTVILLAGQQEAVSELLIRLNAGDLSGCLVKDNIALCGTAVDSGFGGVG